MGILLFIYLNIITLFGFFPKKKLYALSTNSSLGTINMHYLQYDFFLNFNNTSTLKNNFFKKKGNLNIFFLDSVLVDCCDKLMTVNFSIEKKKFFIFNFLIFFFNKNLFLNILNFIFKKKKNLKNAAYIFIQIFLSLFLLSKTHISNISFLNIFKFFDFFFFKEVIFNTNKKQINIISNIINNYTIKHAYSNVFFNKKLLLSQINKYNFVKKNSIDILLPTETPQYLFLLNNFFSKNKKFFFLRNNEIYNKSRYSRNRQTYKTGVFWCIWLTVLTVIGLYFYFYIFLIKFTYIWIFFFIFILSFFFYYFKSKIEKHFFF